MGTTQKKKRNRLSKRNAPKTVPKSAFSKALREGRELISAGDTENGLAALNKLASETRNPAKRSKILLAIGVSESRYSRHTEALGAYTKASQFANQASDIDLTLSAGTGIIRSLLRSLRSEEAKTAAAQLLADLEAAEKRFSDVQNLTPEQLAKQGAITVHARPPRMTVGLTKVANAFMESGLTDEARAFLQKAIQLSPNGASRARQVLAKIALASDQPELAERYARESLLMGRFQAKTTAAWQLYLDARARQNLVPILEPEILASFQQHAKGRIAAASALSITRVLRAHGDPTWKTIATAALGKSSDLTISTEIEKLIHADAKLFSTEEPRKIAARALRLIRSEEVSIQETIAHSKEYVRFSFLAGKQPKLEPIIRIAGKRFPAAALLSIRHAAALGAMMASRHDIARQWLLAHINLAAQLKQPTAWGKANWALARMESLLENNAEAAFYYMEVAANPETPPRFKIQAMLRGLKFLGKSGDTSTDIGQLTTNIRSILKRTDDFRLLLDAARQLALAGSNFATLKSEAADRATILADHAIATAATQAAALADLEYLSRKLYWDLDSQAIVVARWEKLSIERISEFEVIGGSLWYSYLTIVFKSLVDLERSTEADNLAAKVLNNTTATSEGYVMLGSAYADWLFAGADRKKAFEFFRWIIKEAPTHRQAASAHYWIAQNHYANGRLDSAVKSALCIAACFSSGPNSKDETNLLTRSKILISAITKKPLDSTLFTNLPQDYINLQTEGFYHDKKKSN